MKLIYVIFALLLLPLTLFSQTTAILDPAFEQELVNQGIDTNGLNGTILNSDAQAVTTLNLLGNTITDITGIEAFVNLISLNLGNNQIANFPLTALTQLINFTSDNNDALATADFSQNLMLETVFIESEISGGAPYPSITTLDFSQNLNLITLNIHYLNFLTDLILPITNTLTSVDVRGIADPTLDFSLLDSLEIINVRSSLVPTVITLPNETDILRQLHISSINIPIIDVSNYINLERLDLFNTYLEELLLPVTNTFKRLTIWHHNFINPLSLANVPEVEYVDIRFNSTVPLVIDLLSNSLIRTLWLTSNDLNTVDLSNITDLQTLYIYSNNLVNLDVTQNLLLRSLHANNNMLTGIDLTQNSVLDNIQLSNNEITTLDITQNTILMSIIISNNLFTGIGLDLTQNVELYYLAASFNQISSLDITQNIELSSLIIDNNLFTGTDILDQFYTIRLNNNGIWGGNLIVSHNQLAGNIPDFASLIDGEVNDGNQTRRFSFIFNNNNFEFGHFENQHADYVLFDNTIGPPPFNSLVIRDYHYAPQAKVDVVETINANAGDAVTLTTTCAGAQNHYTWFKDGIAIPGAPDSPTYTITSANSCDQAVYHSEITSDLVPFENGNAPGTNGKNLLLIRNDITLNISSPTESCVNLISPIAGSTNVAVNEVLSWTESIGACGYYVSIGTTSGGTDILNNVDVGDVESYVLGTNLPDNTQIFITITPYYANGTILNCTEETFETGTIVNAINCTTLNFPSNGDINIAVNSNISWNAAAGAIGYYISIGTTTGAADIANMIDVGNVTSFTPPTNFSEGIEVFVTITPYNTTGNATNCIEESFTTEIIASIPNCTSLNLPLNGDIAVSINTNISWNPVVEATGYLVTIGTTIGGSDIANAIDVGNITTYSPASNLPENTEIFVTILPYNLVGNSVGCTEESFTTEVSVPSCTTLSYPLHNDINALVTTDISWNAVANAIGYIINVGTSSGATDIANAIDVGNITTYSPVSNLPENTEIFVTILPYNLVGNSVGCTEESFTTEVLPTSCTALNSPLNGESDISVSANLHWNAVANATGYIISIGSVSGGIDIINLLDIGNQTTYNPAMDFPEYTEIFVSIIPYNSLGNAVGCVEESFTTEVLPTSCTNLVMPLNGAADVALNTSISWNAINNATGYFINIGTVSGGSDIENMLDIGAFTTYTPTSDFLENQIIFVRIIPYNSIGNGIGCIEESFTTEILLAGCSNMISPVNNTLNVALDITISWAASQNAVGYTIGIGTSIGSDDIIATTDVGNVTSFIPAINLPQDTLVYVTITAYNAFGMETVCGDDRFTTIAAPPECTHLISPIHGFTNISILTHIQWESSAGANGYILTMGTTIGGNDLVNNVDVGNITAYDYNGVLPENTVVYVRVSPYNSVGEAIGCEEEHFTTELNNPSCTSFISPANGQTNVSVEAELIWSTVNYAEGYYISIGTSPNGTDLLNTIDVGNITTYLPSFIFPENTNIYVKITPYNSTGEALNCNILQFYTEVLPPSCTYLISPFNDEINVSRDTNIYWAPISSATGYRISIGITPNGNEIENNLDVGLTTLYSPLYPFEDSLIIYVNITAYNLAGEALNCEQEQFTIEERTINIPKFFTPNNDAKNDFWLVSDPKNEIKTINIFDRQGKLLNIMKRPDDAWDGLFNGKPLPASDYWYQIELHTGQFLTGHFTLKR